MDPKATLILLGQQVTTGQYTLARETLQIYRNWRKSGGFEPRLRGPGRDETTGGDEIAHGYAQQITTGLLAALKRTGI